MIEITMAVLVAIVVVGSVVSFLGISRRILIDLRQHDRG